MEQTKRSIPELIKVVTEELYLLGYSPATVPRFGLVWEKFKLYSEEKGLQFFSEELGAQFLKESYNYPRVFEGKYPYNERIAVRAIRFIGDYQLYGIILRKRRDQQPEPPEEFIQAINGFVSYCYNERNNAPQTVERKLFIVRYFIECIVNKNCKNYSEIEREHILDFVKILIVLNKRTFGRYIESIRSFLTYLFKYEFINNELHIYLPQMYDNKERKIPTVWSKEDVEKLLNSVDRGNPTGKRDYAILLIVSKLGLRNSDICNMKFEYLNWEKNRIEFTQFKTKQSISLPLFYDIGWAIIDYLKRGRPINC